MGQLTVAFRTQSAGLISAMTEFFRLWKRIEDAHLAPKLSAPVRYALYEGKFIRTIAVPEKDCYPLPDFLEYKDAVMIEPTTIAVQCCSRAQLEAEDDVLIIGAGALGSSLLRIVKLFKPHSIIMADIDPMTIH